MYMYYRLFRNNWHPIFLRKQFFFLGKRSFFTHKSLWNAPRIFLINFIFKLAQAFKSFLKGQISRKLWNLDNSSRSNQVNSCSNYSFRVSRKLYCKTSDRVATQLLSSAVNRILKFCGDEICQQYVAFAEEFGPWPWRDFELCSLQYHKSIHANPCYRTSKFVFLWDHLHLIVTPPNRSAHLIRQANYRNYGTLQSKHSLFDCISLVSMKWSWAYT